MRKLLRRFEIEYIPWLGIGIGYEHKEKFISITLPLCIIGIHCEKNFNSKL